MGSGEAGAPVNSALGSTIVRQVHLLKVKSPNDLCDEEPPN